MKRLAQVVGLGVALTFGAAVLQAEPMVLGVDAMRELAFKAAQAGYAAQALDLTDALLLRDPDDTTALIIRAQALRSMGQLPQARVAAQKAWTLATTDKARFGAAMAMAQVLSTSGRRTGAQLWLRRAAEHAPSARAYDIARRDFGYVKSRNPWVITLDAVAQPSTNVNNGSSQDRMQIAGMPIQFEIPAQSQALSGFEFGAGLSSTYRFSPRGPNRQTEARLGLSAQAVALSADARAQAPAARASDYTYLALEAGLSHRRGMDAAGKTTLRLSGIAGHNWYGGDDLSDYLRLSAGVEHKLTDTSALSFGLAADHAARLDSALQSTDRLAASVGYVFAFGAAQQDQLSLELEAASTDSAAAESRSRALSLSLGWRKAEPVAGIGLAAGLDLTSQVFADSRYADGGRQDLTLAANLAMTFQSVDYMGFSPVLTLQASRAQSNSALHDRQNIGLSIGIKSAF